MTPIQEPAKEVVVFKSRNEAGKTDLEGRRQSKLGGVAGSFIAKSKSPKINVHIQTTPNTTKNAHHNTDIKKRGLQSITSKKQTQTIYAAVALETTNKAASVQSSLQNNRYHRIKDARSTSNTSHKHHMMITNKVPLTIKPHMPSPNQALPAGKSGPPSTTGSLHAEESSEMEHITFNIEPVRHLRSETLSAAI